MILLPLCSSTGGFGIRQRGRSVLPDSGDENTVDVQSGNESGNRCRIGIVPRSIGFASATVWGPHE